MTFLQLIQQNAWPLIKQFVMLYVAAWLLLALMALNLWLTCGMPTAIPEALGLEWAAILSIPDVCREQYEMLVFEWSPAQQFSYSLGLLLYALVLIICAPLLVFKRIKLSATIAKTGWNWWRNRKRNAP